MSAIPLLVTGASGHLGRRVLELLVARGAGPIIATTRKPEALASFADRGVEVRRADFDDEATLAAAFRGAGRALLVSTDALDRPGRRAEQHRAAIRALEAAGASHVVYTSIADRDPGSTFSVAVDHRETEGSLAASRLDHTILRNNLYTDLFLQSLPQAIATGQLVDARGVGSVGFVTREDCARAAAAALASEISGRRTLDVTGPALLTSEDVAAIASELAGRPVAHVSASPEALRSALAGHGLPPFVVDLLVGFDVVIEKGELALVSNAVQTLTGRPPTSVRDFLAQHRAALVGG